MNRRSFLKLLTVGTATAAVAPQVLAETNVLALQQIKLPTAPVDWKPAAKWEYRIESKSILPDNIRISERVWQDHQILQEKMQKQLRLVDLQALQKLKGLR